MNINIYKEYAARISQASSTELVIISYELIITKLEEAEYKFHNGSHDEFVFSLHKAQQTLTHMMDSLNYEYKISYDLLSLYLYINKKIANSVCKLDPKALENSISILMKLKSGFEGIKDKDRFGSVMDNTQQIYAGLTYRKDKLIEVNADFENLSRGYTI